MTCEKCGGLGWYKYDDHHGKPCEICCKHDQGCFELIEGYSGYIEGHEDNMCCRMCGKLHREISVTR